MFDFYKGLTRKNSSFLDLDKFYQPTPAITLASSYNWARASMSKANTEDIKTFIQDWLPL